MNPIAIEKCQKLLNDAYIFFENLERSKTFDEVDSAWSGVLITAHRVYSKLEQGAKANPQSYAWWSEKKKERRQDSLLNYAWHARNVDEHGLDNITDRAEAYTAFGVGPGTWGINMRTGGPDGSPGFAKITALGDQVAGESKFVEAKPVRLVLAKVVDRGVSYEPPKGELTPIEASKTIVNFLCGIIEEAKRFTN